VAPIILNGADWFRGIGTERSPGTKVYTMLGDVNVTGLIEMPMGTTLREVIDLYGGGMKGGKAFKCAQTGGASGTLIPPELLDVPMDFASMAEKGAGLGSGALLICDEETDIVELAYVLVRFFKTESCGKCTPCRVGTAQMQEALYRLKEGFAKQADLDRLEEIAHYVRDASFCGLGQAAPVPILTGLRYFRDEFEAKLR
jgi:NADH:ubiquinone oxidoreductase subunit F (NADH-binding)